MALLYENVFKYSSLYKKVVKTMKVDKFGVASLVVGLILLVAMLHFGFMSNGVWTLEGLINAVVTAIEGGILILAVIMILIGIMLLVL